MKEEETFYSNCKNKDHIQNKGAKDILNKHRILLTENCRKALYYQISDLAVANHWGRGVVACGLTCSQACFIYFDFDLITFTLTKILAMH